MKHTRALCLSLAFLAAVLMLWYGSIFVLQRGSRMQLEQLSGDPEQLKGFLLEGALYDGTFEQDFMLKNGRIKNHFHSREYDSVRRPEEPSATMYMKPVITENSSSMKEYPNGDFTVWKMDTDRIRMQLMWNGSDDRHMQLYTDVEVLGDPGLFQFEAYPDREYREAFWHHMTVYPYYHQQNNGYSWASAVRTGGEDYVIANLPWGGAQLYRVTETVQDENYYSMSSKPSQTKQECIDASFSTENLGNAELVVEYDVNTANQIITVAQLQDKFVVLTLSLADCTGSVMDEKGWLSNAEGPAKSGVFARVYDSNMKEEAVIPLLDLPSGEWWTVTVGIGEQPGSENNLCMILNAGSGKNDRQINAAAALHLDENGVQLVDQLLYPKNGKAAERNDLDFSEKEVRDLIAVQTDETGEKLMIVWQSKMGYDSKTNQLSGMDLYMEVFENGESVYFGELDSGWKQDFLGETDAYTPVMPFAYRRECSFPFRNGEFTIADYGVPRWWKIAVGQDR